MGEKNGNFGAIGIYVVLVHKGCLSQKQLVSAKCKLELRVSLLMQFARRCQTRAVLFLSRTSAVRSYKNEQMNDRYQSAILIGQVLVYPSK